MIQTPKLTRRRDQDEEEIPPPDPYLTSIPDPSHLSITPSHSSSPEGNPRRSIRRSYKLTIPSRPSPRPISPQVGIQREKASYLQIQYSTSPLSYRPSQLRIVVLKGKRSRARSRRIWNSRRGYRISILRALCFIRHYTISGPWTRNTQRPTMIKRSIGQTSYVHPRPPLSYPLAYHLLYCSTIEKS